MKKFLILCLILLGCNKDQEMFVGSQKIYIQSAQKLEFNVDVMQNEEQWQKGLMFYKKMPAQNGMLFDFKAVHDVKMWMKNTYLALDMLFFDKDGSLVYIEKNAEPLTLNSRGPDFAVRFVLEINAGESDKLNIKMGDKLIAGEEK